MELTREHALSTLKTYTKSEALLKHAFAVEGVMRAFAREAGEEKWFSQEEVNEIVKKRLARERDGQQGPAFGQAGRLAKELALREQEVLKRERKIQAKEELAAGGLPAEAAELLHYDSEEAFRDSFSAMQELLLDKLQVSVQEMFREGGRVPPRSTESAPARPDPLKAAFLPRK